MRIFAFVPTDTGYAGVITRAGLGEIRWLIDRAESWSADHDLGAVSPADRLYPLASTDDAVAAEFAEFTFADLKSGRAQRFAWLREVFSHDVPLVARADGPRLAAGLNDLRLVLGRAFELDVWVDDDPWPSWRARLVQLQEQLAIMLESLVELMFTELGSP